MFWGFPIGVRVDSTLAAMASKKNKFQKIVVSQFSQANCKRDNNEKSNIIGQKHGQKSR